MKGLKNFYFWLSFTMTILFIVGAPMIPLGFIYRDNYLWAGILGIVFTVIGFYGMPLMWTAFAKITKKYRVYRAITEEGLMSVSEIADHLSRKEYLVINDIRYLIERLFLKDYIFDGHKLRLNERKRVSVVQEIRDCPYCGAHSMAITKKGFKCEYCGSEIVKKVC